MVERAQEVGRLLRAPKTAELIASDLRRQIVRGELKAGEILPPEIQLMEQYGVSRPTLREAFRILETETLISVRRGSRGGAQVMTPDLSVAARYVGLLLQLQGTTLEDLYEARMVSEPVCARMLALRRTQQDIDDLRACNDELRQAVAAGAESIPNPTRWADLTYRFHELIMQRSGNKTLALQGAVLADIVATHLRSSVNQNGGRTSDTHFQRTIRSYDKLISLVEAGDADGAERHWRSHMKTAAKVLFAGQKGKPVVELFT